MTQYPDCVVDVKVEMTELLGADTNLYLSEGDIQFTGVVPTGSTNCKMDDNIKVCFDARKIHLFDYETEKTITN